jgi:hypothetical protein
VNQQFHSRQFRKSSAIRAFRFSLPLSQRPPLASPWPIPYSLSAMPFLLFSCSYELQILQLLCFDIHTHCPGVYPLLPLGNSPLITRHWAQVLSFHTLPNSFALVKISTLLFSCKSKLFCKNTRGWGSPPSLAEKRQATSNCHIELSRALPFRVGQAFLPVLFHGSRATGHGLPLFPRHGLMGLFRGPDPIGHRA